MKMESYVYAPYDGTVTDVVVEGGQNVSAYQPLVRVARAEEKTDVDPYQLHQQSWCAWPAG